MKRFSYISFFIIEVVIVFLLKANLIHLSCFFKAVFHIPCPGCGLTRAMSELIHFNFLKAIYYNVLIIPVILFLACFNFFVVLDVIKGENRVLCFLEKIGMRWRLLFLALIITEVLNIYHDI